MKFIYKNTGKRINRFEFFGWTIILSVLWFTNRNLVENEIVRYFTYFLLIIIYLVISYFRTTDYGNPFKSGFYWFLIPFFNIFVFFELYLKKGDPNPNKFGNPSKVGFFDEEKTLISNPLDIEENEFSEKDVSQNLFLHNTSKSVNQDFSESIGEKELSELVEGDKNYLIISDKEEEKCTIFFIEGGNIHDYLFKVWNVADGDFVLKDQLIVTLRSYPIGFEVKARKNGFIKCNDSSSFRIFKDCKIELFSIYMNDLDRQRETISVCPSVIKDSFTNEDHYSWRKIQISSELSFFVESVTGKDYIHFEHSYPELNLREEDKILFLLSNNDLLQFHLINGKYKKSKNLRGFRLPLYFEDIDLFSKFSIEKIRIHKVIENQNIDTIVGGVKGMPIKDFQYLTKGIFTNLGEFNATHDNYQPLTRLLDDFENIPINDRCYVYLMIDTTNGYHKIGISNKPGYREKTLQSEKPTIELICHKHFPSRKISESIEKALHETFKEKRIRGEWFNLNELDIGQIMETLR